MAGLGAKLFTAFSKLTAAQVNGYLMDQSIMRFASAAVRDAAFGGAGEPTLAEGMTCYLDDTNQIQSYTGSAWVTIVNTERPAGLELITSKSLSTSTTNVEGCFTSQYRDYLVTLNGVGTSAANAIWYRMLSGTTPAAGNYYYSFRGLTSGGGSDDVSQNNFAQGYAGMNTPSSGASTGDTRIHF